MYWQLVRMLHAPISTSERKKGFGIVGDREPEGKVWQRLVGLQKRVWRVMLTGERGTSALSSAASALAEGLVQEGRKLRWQSSEQVRTSMKRGRPCFARLDSPSACLKPDVYAHVSPEFSRSKTYTGLPSLLTAAYRLD